MSLDTLGFATGYCVVDAKATVAPRCHCHCGITVVGKKDAAQGRFNAATPAVHVCSSAKTLVQLPPRERCPVL